MYLNGELIYSKLETDERFLESFKRSIGYVKLLAELDLLKDPSAKSEAGDELGEVSDPPQFHRERRPGFGTFRFSRSLCVTFLAERCEPG